MKHLGDLLASFGLLDPGAFARFAEAHRNAEGSLGALLVAEGFVTEGQLMEALQSGLGLGVTDLSTAALSPELSRVLPGSLARRHGIAPVALTPEGLRLAMSDPFDLGALEEARQAAHRPILPVLAPPSAIERTLSVLYSSENAARAIQEMERSGLSSGEESAVFLSSDITDNENAAPTIRLVNSILTRAVTEGASDIHLEPGDGELTVRMRVDGMLHTILTVPKALQGPVLSRIKVMANLDIAERRLPQDGRASIHTGGADVDLRVSTLPTLYGEKVVIRLLDRSVGLLTKEKIGLRPDDFAKYLGLVGLRQGVILVVGPTGSGKSSTMYTILQELNREEVNIVTLEDPVEYDLPGVNQVQINEKTGLTFAGGLRAVLRQDPDIICIGEIRDGETAEIAMRAAITGHLVLSTVHTGDAAGTVDRLLDIGVEPYLIGSALRGIISQRLVRRVCPACREEYVPDREILEEIGLTPAPGDRFYHGTGCHECFGTGYRGRTGVFEILTLDRDLRRRISTRGSAADLSDALSAPGYVTLEENCRRLVREGVTTAEEVRRVISQTEAAGGGR